MAEVHGILQLDEQFPFAGHEENVENQVHVDAAQHTHKSKKHDALSLEKLTGYVGMLG